MPNPIEAVFNMLKISIACHKSRRLLTASNGG